MTAMNPGHWIRPAPSPPHVLLQVRRLEELTIRKFTQEDTAMPSPKHLDHDAILQDRAAGMSRESLYKALSPDGNPEMATFFKVVRALGVQLHASEI